MRNERNLLALALVLGAVLRLPALGAPALGAEEAAHAWRAARAAAEGEVVADGVTSPLLASAQGTLFVLVEPNAFLARLPAALCGLALLLAPGLLKDAWGATRAIALAILLATDPALIRFSREASGVSASVLAGTLAAAALVRWSAAGRGRAARGRSWALVASAALGMLVTTGPEGWSVALLVALVAIVVRPWASCPPRWGHCASAFGASALLAATAGLSAIPWAGGVSASLTVWLGLWAQPTDAAALLRLVRAEPLTILLAAIGLAQAWRVARGRAAALVAALAWGLVLAVRPSAGSVAALALVLAVCAAYGVAALAERAVRRRPVRWALAAAGALATFVQAAAAARPLMPSASVAAAPDLETLGADLERIAVQRGREAHELPVLILGERPDPSVGWALRKQRRVQFVAARPAEDGDVRPVLVSPAAEPAAAPPAGYVGATYASAGGKVNLWVPLEP